ncbi:cutinase transcription factor 1 beta [Trichoderma asperellum]|uniref:Cutinase transcription factor 1 beta n=1 Tax=Trichoderma asperellum TaxID=101201 RepID=A0A6V8R1Y2_TRIAP|nr:cutinase transcription factor 1 beta [Trichoderma asperellum]
MAQSDDQTPPSSTAASSTSRKKRASKACSCCRARKIRCDVLKTGVPCTKCQLDGFDCLVQARKKRRGKNEPVKEPPSLGDELRINNAARPPEMPRSIPQHAMLHQVPHYPFFRSFAPDGQSSLLAVSRDDDDVSGAIKHSRLDEEDIQYLRRKGALTLPPKRVMDEFVSNYFQLFHPFFPIIDKSSFLEGYYRNDRSAALHSHGTSLLLLQAIIFTASATVPASTLRDAGFTTRKDARNQLHRRARYLYEFDFESDDITNIQALLLMSHYYPSMVEQKHTWFWVHQAISLSQGLGLHRSAGQEPQHSLWARIWWACLVRDRLTTLGTGRPMHINSLDCTVPMLTLDDLKEDGDSEDDRTVKEFFIDFVKLCQYMEGVLSLPHNMATAAGSLPEQISLCEETLQHWRLNLVPSARLHEENSRDFDKRGICTLYRAILHLIYNIVIMGLHKSYQVLDESRPSGAQLPLPKVQAAAEDSTRLAVELLGDIYWHASFYHDFFTLAASHSQGPTTHASGIEQDPLVAFFNDHMPAKQPSGKGIELSSQTPSWRRPLTANNADGNPIKPTVAQNQDHGTTDHSAMPVTTTNIQTGLLAEAPTVQTSSPTYEADPGDLELADAAISDAANLQLFEDWLDEFGYFQNIFQSA